MSDHVYKIREYAGSSPEGQDGAIRNAVERAAQIEGQLRWFEVTETRGQIIDGRIAHWQVVVRVGSSLT